jgi:hypothetical protein
MSSGKLTPLGDPAPNAPKWFSAVAIIRLAADMDWLHKATKDVAKFWRQKRERGANALKHNTGNEKSDTDENFHRKHESSGYWSLISVIGACY